MCHEIRVAKVRASGKVKIQNESTWGKKEIEIWTVNNEKPAEQLNCSWILGNTLAFVKIVLIVQS